MTRPLVYTPEEVFALLRVSRSLGYSLIREGILPARRLGKRRLIIVRAEFEAWLADGTWQPPAGGGA